MRKYSIQYMWIIYLYLSAIKDIIVYNGRITKMRKVSENKANVYFKL